MKAASPRALLRAQFLRFAMVGAAGFVVDETVLGLLHNLAGLHATVAGALSIFCAMTFTWLGNRSFTFHAHAARGARAMAAEWLRFAAANSVGAIINYSTFLLLVNWAPSPASNPFLAKAAGVGAGMILNFLSARRLVFRAHHAAPQSAEVTPIASPALRMAAAIPSAEEEDTAGSDAPG